MTSSRDYAKNRWIDRETDQDIEYVFMGVRLKVNLLMGEVVILDDGREEKIRLVDLRYRPKKVMNVIEGMKKY